MTTAKATIIDEIQTIEQEKNDKMLELTMLTKEVNEIKTKEEQVKNELKNITARINECKEKILLNAIVHGADFSIRHMQRKDFAERHRPRSRFQHPARHERTIYPFLLHHLSARPQIPQRLLRKRNRKRKRLVERDA